MKTAIFPGSFNPWHEGHQEVLNKALKVFDRVIVARGINLSKDAYEPMKPPTNVNVIYTEFTGLLKDYINNSLNEINAIIKGLRNSNDLEYEKIQQYWNEDLGIYIPIFYIIANRDLVHISSSAIRTLNKFKEKDLK